MCHSCNLSVSELLSMKDVTETIPISSISSRDAGLIWSVSARRPSVIGGLRQDRRAHHKPGESSLKWMWMTEYSLEGKALTVVCLRPDCMCVCDLSCTPQIGGIRVGGKLHGRVWSGLYSRPSDLMEQRWRTHSGAPDVFSASSLSLSHLFVVSQISDSAFAYFISRS